MDRQAFHSDRAGKVVLVPGEPSYWAFVPTPLPPELNWTPPLVGALSRADRALAELSALARSLPNPHLLIRPFMRQEAVLSSRIEGTRASLPDLYAYEAGQPALFEMPDDVREVHNYVVALQYGLDRIAELPLSLRLLREAHATLLEGVRGEQRTPGEFRRTQNWIGPPQSTRSNAPFVPPPPPEMNECLDLFEKWLHAESDIPPLIRIALAHYQFEAIHPFLDGNGRIGRLLIIFLMCLWDLLSEPVLYLSAYFEAHRQAYYDHLLSVSQRGAWEQWVAFFLDGVAVQALDARARARRLVDLREEYRDRLQSERASGRLLQVVDFLFARPIMTISNLRAAMGLWQMQAQRYVERLEALGILRETTGRSRNRVYVADAIMQAVQEPLPAPEASADDTG